MRKNNLLILTVVVFLVVAALYLLGRLYLFKDKGPMISVKSQDPRISLSFNNLPALEEYINEFEVFELGIGVPVKNEDTNLYTTADWKQIDRLEFIFASEPQPIPLSGQEDVDNFTYWVEVKDRRASVKFHHRQASNLVEQEEFERAERSISIALFQSLYRVTHFGPRRYYNHDEFQTFAKDLLEKENILELRSNSDE